MSGFYNKTRHRFNRLFFFLFQIGASCGGDSRYVKVSDSKSGNENDEISQYTPKHQYGSQQWFPRRRSRFTLHLILLAELQLQHPERIHGHPQADPGQLDEQPGHGQAAAGLLAESGRQRDRDESGDGHYREYIRFAVVEQSGGAEATAPVHGLHRQPEHKRHPGPPLSHHIPKNPRGEQQHLQQLQRTEHSVEFDL